MVDECRYLVNNIVLLSNLCRDSSVVSRNLCSDVSYLLEQLRYAKVDIPSDVENRILGHLADYDSFRDQVDRSGVLNFEF